MSSKAIDIGYSLELVVGNTDLLLVDECERRIGLVSENLNFYLT
jgi:hypothetical protein